MKILEQLYIYNERYGKGSDKCRLINLRLQKKELETRFLNLTMCSSSR